MKLSISRNRSGKALSELSEGNLKWGGDRLNAVKGRALRRSGM